MTQGETSLRGEGGTGHFKSYILEGGHEVLMTLLIYCLYSLGIEVIPVTAEQLGNETPCV